MKTLLSQEKTQMASTHSVQNGDCSKSNHADNVLPPEHDNCKEPEPKPDPQNPSQSKDKDFGVPEIMPRTGDEYQVELPTLFESHSECVKSHPNQSFLIGLPVMLTWINTNIKPIKTESMEELRHLPTAEKMSDRGHILVPGLVDVCWDALEKDSFVLGLYIFEKNFDEVKRFVGTKKMGDVLSFYYERFYHTHEYQRWKDCRKRKKGIYGQKIFSGARQNEFLSRILVDVSDERRNEILEVSKMFGDDKITLSEYVFSLKSMVGIKILVDTVGIGKGKLDLTEMPLENSKSNPARPEIPTGKALSVLTTEEIINFLSGDYRLSKARANDIFWEAVWPRLLHRGWHSEQPKNQGYISQCLVFLIPGVKKFSRRKLVKGEHYFDSVTDVLGKVAKEPELININEDEARLSEEKKNKEKVDKESQPVSEKESEKHCYLQPRTPVRNADIKLTVVDTSLSGGKIRELRAFPSEVSDKQDFVVDRDEHKIAKKPSKKIVRSVSPDPKNKDKKVPKSRKTKQDSVDNVGPVYKRSRSLVACSREETNASSSGVNGVMENLSSKLGLSQDKVASSSGDGPVKNGRPRVLWDLNLPQPPPDYENPEQGIGQGRGSNGPANNSFTTLLSSQQSVGQVGSSNGPGNNSLLAPLAAEQGVGQGGGSSGPDNYGLPGPQGAEQGIGQGGGSNGPDNNGLAAPPAAEPNVGQGGGSSGPDNNGLSGHPAAEQGIGQGGGSNGSVNNGLPASPANEVRPEQVVDLNPRRLSTRTRPPTMRVVEAISCGHLTVSRKRKVKGVSSNRKAAKRGAGGAGPSEPANGPPSQESGEDDNSALNSGNSNVEPRDPSDANGDSVSGQ
ncbi:hypothetical protein CASFOL_030056 [Castilleja foliolosa]|uniref:SANT domain-containing protein n=1 Tax=Castilleja foliolosa TaxID=1961234 RepID=A0ABD3CCR1_9LAMI